MDLYNETINEFVDWVTGIDSYTGENVTNGLQVSGSAIRQLLQNRLRNPFVLKEDVANNKYRMFSSETAYQLWSENPSDNSELELFNFVRPSDYKLTFIGLNDTNRYIRYGDKDGLDSRIQYTWNISNDEGTSSESLQVTYTITNESTGTIHSFTRWYNRGEAVDFNVYQYLKPGRNDIVISGIGVLNGARNSAHFNIVVLELSLTSQFLFYKKYTSGTYITIPCMFTRNDVSGTARVHYVIDAGANVQEWTTDVLSNSGTEVDVLKAILLDLQPGQHTLLIYADCSYNDGSVTIRTNLLYFTFVIATSDISVLKYICIGTSFNSGLYPINDLRLSATQYIQQKLQWGYYTEALSTDSRIAVVWKLYRNEDDENPIVLSTMNADTQTKSSDLQYIPTIYSEYDLQGNPTTFLSAQYNNSELLRIPILIVQNGDFSVYEVVPYDFKLSAYGKTNDSSDRLNWTYGQYATTFTGIQWNNNSGWYNNSFRTSDENGYATINYAPFEGYSMSPGNGEPGQGKTIEIEFETEKVNDDNDVLVCFGQPNRGRIEITPTEATLYNNGNEVVIRTNYKSNERIKLQFIMNPVTDELNKQSGLVYIVNNGILERATSGAGGTYSNVGTIKIGGSNSGVRVYSMRIYNRALSYTDAYNNFVYDSDDKAAIYERNDIVGTNGEISYDLCKNKIDTILISGDLSSILNLNAMKDESESEVTIERTCPSDTTKNFKINRAKIRKHGQSTLNYPVSSMKFWLNKSMDDNVVPAFEIAPQDPLQLNKNRYRMKNDSIPANKFVLQANYADSSGVHNGGLQRLILSTWYNAVIDGKYLLRTLPLLFTTISSGDKSKYGLDNVWNDYFPNTPFPYQIRVAPDSFPCAVFYKNVGEDTQTFLGQYVFMEDKKSDFNYGERSIYRILNDPFCLTAAHAKEDTAANRIWNNNNVLRIEVVESNNEYSSFITADQFDTIENIVNESTGAVIGQRYKWERAYEMIYPDPDDLDSTQFPRKAQPFVDWYNWVVSTKNNQSKFEAEAADHLDLYKMAAYYIFAMRFGLVDSLERNAQIKTYDGVHFHYEPWDMDIALGNKNDGGIAYNPPINRDTKLSTSTYAFSGRAADEITGQVVSSNWLWDALEAWDEWSNVIVPKVADALYTAGLTYGNICTMFDNNYAAAWCETIYNKSGDFKYIQSRNNDAFLNWLQGSRLTHRHWWLSTSMDYYDAKWFCGDYKNHSIYITANVSLGNQVTEESEEGVSGNTGSGKTITVTPNKSTYMVIQKDNQTIGTRLVTPQQPLVYEVPVMNTKNPFHIFGANYIESVDFSLIARGLDAVDFSGVYSDVLGSPLKSINIGTDIELSGAGYTTVLASMGGGIRGSKESFENLLELNIRGLQNYTSLYSLIYAFDITSLKNVYAMGSGIQNFYSSQSGNKFDKIEIPSSINNFQVNNTTWNTLEFWNCAKDGANGTLTLCPTIVPATLHTLVLNGTSCLNINSINLVKAWLLAISAAGEDFADYTFSADNINWSMATLGSNANLLTYTELSQLALMQGTMRGYILLKNENDIELTTQQLTQIKTWFGDSVFDRNSSGLVVDHQKEYIQINIGGDIIVQNGEIYLEEGKRASLNATRFLLSEENTDNYVWGVEAVNSAYTSKSKCYIIPAQESLDGVTYLQSEESDIGANYDVLISVAVADVVYNTTLHIIGVTYPTDIHLYCENKNQAVPRETPNYIEFQMTNMSAELYATSDQDYTASIKGIKYTISDNIGSSVYYNTLTGADTFGEWNDQHLTLQKGSIGFIASVPQGWGAEDDEQFIYTVYAEVVFTSNKKITIIKNILVANDNTVIVNTLKLDMYDAIKTLWDSQFTSNLLTTTSLYRVHLLELSGTLSFASTLPSLITNNNEVLLKYIPNVTGISLSGAQSLSHTGSQLDFSGMRDLVELNITNCSGLSGTIDLSGTSIQRIYASGTTVNFTLPSNVYLTNYELGTPTSVVISNPSHVDPSGVSLDSSVNLNTVTLLNIDYSTLSTYTTFAKIFNL